MSSRLHELSALGQSVWIDYLSRDLIESGALARRSVFIQGPAARELARVDVERLRND